MEILPFQSNMIGPLVKAYNQAVAGIPHCYRATTIDFESELAPVLSGEPGDTRREEALFVAVIDRRLAGFVHVAVGPPKPGDDPEEGLIRFFWYRPGNREAGAALLRAAEAHCLAHGVTAINAFPQKHRYSFYMLKAAYMSDRLGHVAGLLGVSGYSRSEGEVFLDWPEFSAAQPGPLPDGLPVSVLHSDGLGRLPGFTIRVAPEGKEIGICENVSVGDFSRDRLAQEWFFTTWLGVDTEYQSLGLGRWLMQRALWEAQIIGYRHAAISTAWQNHRALLFYSNFGYQVSGWTYGFRRELA